ncbi:MAG: hypothetical protein FWF51_02260 [Chitinivibrionia bacterium]|nr:hypothetical protein [Chitinivibrionia bacterium]
MLSKSADEATANFNKRFKSNGFTVVQVGNRGVNYNNAAQERDSNAVKKFADSAFFDFTMHGRKC